MCQMMDTHRHRPFGCNCHRNSATPPAHIARPPPGPCGAARNGAHATAMHMHAECSPLELGGAPPAECKCPPELHTAQRRKTPPLLFHSNSAVTCRHTPRSLICPLVSLPRMFLPAFLDKRTPVLIAVLLECRRFVCCFSLVKFGS